MRDLAWMFGEALAVLGLFQVMIWLNNARWGIQKRVVMLSKSPLAELESYGFAPSSTLCAYRTEHDLMMYEVGYTGQVKDYTTEIYFDPKTGWLAHPNFRVRVYFSPNDNGDALPQNFLQNISDRDNTFRSEYISLMEKYIEGRVPVGRFSWPKTERLIAAANQLARELAGVGIKPTNY